MTASSDCLPLCLTIRHSGGASKGQHAHARRRSSDAEWFMRDGGSEACVVGHGPGGRSSQLAGVLWKKHGTHQNGGGGSNSSSKWAKRFFVIRDSFLLYYMESEQKEFGRHPHFNVHPKGIFPLGSTDIQLRSEAGHHYAIHIMGSELLSPLVIAADTEQDRDRWVSLLRQASRITWSNAQLGDSMIRRLENHGLQMAEEKQVYFDKLQLEAEALNDEKVRAESLERLNVELEKEKQKMEQFASELKEEYDKMKIELGETLEAMKSVEETKLTLKGTIEQLQTTLEDLERTKKNTITRIKSKQRPALGPLMVEVGDGGLEVPSAPSSPLSESPSATLKDIEDKIRSLMDSKADVEKQLEENDERERILEEEKRVISDHAEQLHVSMRDFAAQKSATELELKDEVLARIQAERRLVEADRTLKRLESVIQRHTDSSVDVEQLRDEMMGDVKCLKKFFENLGAEARLDADKSVMVKNAVHVRKTMVRRAQTLKFQTLKKQRGSVRRSESIDKLDGECQKGGAHADSEA